MEIIKAIKRFFREYRVVVTFKSYAKETEKDGACFQVLPIINFWYNRYIPIYDNRLFIGWLMWGFIIYFCQDYKNHCKKEE